MPVLTAIDLDRHDKVRANIDLPGVPAGTKGKVLQKTGVTWIRYRVLFENGVEHGLLDGRHLVRPKEFVPLDQRTAVVEQAEGGGAGDGGASAAVDDGGGAGAADNAFGVPSHLLERSKMARERLGAG
jgi:hypothetical protein